MKRFLGVLIGILWLTPLAYAAFDDVQLTAGSTLNITVGGNQLNFTVAAGKVQTLTVTNTQILAVLSAGSLIDITSPDKQTFTYTTGAAVANFTCSDSSSVLNVSLNAGADQTITVTPTGGTCINSNSQPPAGGGAPVDVNPPAPAPDTSSGSSSGGSSAPASTPAPASNTPAATLPAQALTTVVPATVVAQPAPAAQMVSPVFNANLTPGASNSDIKRLQQLLGVQSTGYFGALTKKAVMDFQKKYGLPQVGTVGPMTRAKLKEIFGSTAPSSNSNAPATTPAPASNTSAQSQLNNLLKQLQDLQNKLKAK